MKIGIMQPYFFPYIGYFSLINEVDHFILLDEVQFIRHGWIERNRILKPSGGWQYIRVPLQKHSQKTKIREIRIEERSDWRRKLEAQLEHYKKAPYYEQVKELVVQALECRAGRIAELDLECLRAVCKYLGIDTPIEIFSEMNLEIEPVHASDEWALNICKCIPDAVEYWNPPGGSEFFDRAKYEKEGIRLIFQEMELEAYRQNREAFEPGLSMIDVMMFNSPDRIRTMMKSYRTF